jgi:hypothetical protein
MPDYDWFAFTDRPPSERFPEWTFGYALWREFGRGVPETLPRLLDDLIRSRGGAKWGQEALTCPRVFISHRQADRVRALEIAKIAEQEGFQYWLDVLEPALLPGNRTHSGREASLEIATIIEMALLNCTHVLAVMTPLTEGSRWVPYEYGRVKDSSSHSSTAGCWIDSRLQSHALAEYLLLGIQTRNDQEIAQWLRDELAAWRSSHPGCTSNAGDDVHSERTGSTQPVEDPYSVVLDHNITVRRKPLLLKPR